MADIHASFYADLVTAKAGVRDDAVRSAFASVDRATFVGPGPWKIITPVGYVETPSDDPSFVYQDVVIALAPERQINNGEPSLHARCIAALGVRQGENILHVGAGTGYYTAILATLTGASGSVAAYELEADLAAKAVTHLTAFAHVTIHARTASEPPLPTSDVIYVNAGATFPPAAWLDALNVGGRLLFPLTSDQGPGVMMLVTRRSEHSHDAKIISGAAFIPCAGARDEAASIALWGALTKGTHATVRSFHRGTAPNDTCWLSGDGWWFSTQTNES